MTGATDIPREQSTSRPEKDDKAPPAMTPAAETMVPFPVLGAPTVVHVSKLSSEAISRCDLGDVEYVVIEPARDGMRLRPAAIEDQVQYEQEGGIGHVTYSLGEFLDEFTDAPSHPAPTFERLAQFKRDYSKLPQSERQLFRAAVKKFVSPLATTPPTDPGFVQIRELSDHPGFYEMRFGADTRAIYTFGQAVRRGQPHVIWCRIASAATLDRALAFCNPAD